MNELSSQKFRLIRTGGLRFLGLLIKIAKKIAPGKTEIYPAWQGMQDMRNMMDKRTTLQTKNNNRYPDMQWTSVKDLFKKHGNTF